MRAGIDGLLTPHPLGATLPVVFREDDFTQRFCAGLDSVLAPVLATLDSLPAYFDPATAPDDMLAWLAGWMGIVVDGHQSADRQRRLVRTGAEILRWRGTVRGVRGAVRGLFGADPEIIEPGSSRWSTTAGSPLPPAAAPDLLVRLAVDDPAGFDLRRLDALVALVKPAHLEHRVEVTAR
ncbi:phage tail protein [Nakamurella deserti]|uniref:phage tail protein n=1 Tax=Nakamurella deserti TaxID=2164074 RepID=UPI000DBE1918|nr:phage tail protein [Nakamurella deserti]